jgi:hypothetical protein
VTKAKKARLLSPPSGAPRRIAEVIPKMKRRQEGNLVSYFGFTFPKLLRIFREYRSLYPDGKLRIYLLAAFAIAMSALISVAVCIGAVG